MPKVIGVEDQVRAAADPVSRSVRASVEFTKKSPPRYGIRWVSARFAEASVCSCGT
ncbi:hypothetical protein D3C83_123700 [compost metagenome]